MINSFLLSTPPPPALFHPNPVKSKIYTLDTAARADPFADIPIVVSMEDEEESEPARLINDLSSDAKGIGIEN